MQDCIKIRDPVCPLNLNPRDVGFDDQLLQNTEAKSSSPKVCSKEKKNEIDPSLLSDEEKKNARYRRSKSGVSKVPLFLLNNTSSSLKRDKSVSRIVMEKVAKSLSDSSTPF